MSSTPATESAATARPALLETGPNDRYFDYCLQPYEPRVPPVGKLRAENILWAALEQAGAMSLRPALLALQESLGRDMTVWGVKHDGERLWLELYFYDPQKEDPRATVTGVAETLAPWVRIVPDVPEWIPYMMVSFDLFADSVQDGTVELLNLYLTGTDEHQGRSYEVTAEGAELRNTYRFMPPKSEVDLMLGLVQSSMFVRFDDDPRVLSRVVPPKLFACKRVCVSKKRFSDGIYYSGIDVDQLLWFLGYFGYPDGVTGFVHAHREGFEHLYFDVGVDYRQDGDGAIVHPKTSFYGTL